MVLGLDAGHGAQGISHGATMAGGVVAFVAQQSDCSGKFFDQLLKQLSLLVQMLAEIPKEPRIVAIIT